MDALALSKELGMEWKEVLLAVNNQFNSKIKHFRNKLTDKQIKFVRGEFSLQAERDTREVPKAVDSTKAELIAWEGMPWDKSERAKTKGHEEWREEHPEAWRAYLDYERILIKKERARYIKKMKEGWR